MPESLIQPLTQFGVAGLMGVLWVWERLMSRRRELQLDEAHARIMRREEEIAVLIDLARRNAAALERFELTQRELQKVLEGMSESIRRQG